VRFLSIVPRSVLPALAESSDARFAGLWAAEALRIEAWRPRYGTEADDKTIPQELDYTRTAVHFDKGCYKGQETVARVHNLGRPPRRRRRVAAVRAGFPERAGRQDARAGFDFQSFR